MLEFADHLTQLWLGYCPVRIVFGMGCIDQLGQLTTQYAKSVLLVTGDFAPKTGLLAQCSVYLEHAGIRYDVFSSIGSEPTVEEVNQIVSIVKSNSFKGLVAVGGGSVIDACKAASVIAVQGGLAEEYLAGERVVLNSSLPVVAVPTTAGTGAELSRGAILGWEERSYKGGIRGDAVFPSIAIVDPELTLSLPIEYIKITGFDIFTHAVETYISRKATPITSMYSRDAIRAVCHYLPKALENPRDSSARTILSFYSMLMGYNLANSTTCLPHRLQYPLGAITKTPHALGLAAIYPAWVQITHQSDPQRFGNVTNWIREGLDLQVQYTTNEILELVSTFMKKINLTPTLQDLDVNEDLCDKMARMVSGKLDSDPWWYEGADISTIYKTALHPIKG